MNFNVEKCDPELGQKVVAHLRKIGMLGCEKEEQLPMEEKIKIATPHFEKVLDTLGFNLDDPNTNETAKRWVKMMVKDLLWRMYAETFPKVKLIPKSLHKVCVLITFKLCGAIRLVQTAVLALAVDVC